MGSIFQTWKKQIIDQINCQDSLGDLRDSLKTSLDEIEEYINDQRKISSSDLTQVKKE